MAIRLLIAEDHGPLRHHLVQYFTLFGIQCVQAESVSDALPHIEEEEVDGVMVDLLLQGRLSIPVINRAIKHDVPVLIHTAFDRDSVRRQIGPAFKRCTMVDKPYELSLLRNRIISMVRNSKAVNGG